MAGQASAAWGGGLATRVRRVAASCRVSDVPAFSLSFLAEGESTFEIAVGLATLCIRLRRPPYAFASMTARLAERLAFCLVQP